jgi:hypothetical protein
MYYGWSLAAPNKTCIRDGGLSRKKGARTWAPLAILFVRQTEASETRVYLQLLVAWSGAKNRQKWTGIRCGVSFVGVPSTLLRTGSSNAPRRKICEASLRMTSFVDKQSFAESEYVDTP